MLLTLRIGEGFTLRVPDARAIGVRPGVLPGV